MGVNYHSSVSTATLWKPSDINPRFSDLDEAITQTKSLVQCCGGALSWDDTALHWSLDMKIVFADPDSGKMVVNVLNAGSIAIPANNIAYVDLSTVPDATVSATYVAYSTASTALVPADRMILGAVNTANDFYPAQLTPSLSDMLNTAIGASIVKHNVTATAYHIGPSTFTENNIVVFSSVGLPLDSGKGISEMATHAQQHSIDATADHAGTITEGNILVGSSVGLMRDSSVAITDLTGIATHAQQHNVTATADHVGPATFTEGNISIFSSVGLPVDGGTSVHSIQHAIDSTADHTGTITEGNILVGSTDGLIKDSDRDLYSLQGGRESTLTCSAAVSVDFTTAETQVLQLTTNCTVTLATANINNGQVYRLRVQQDATGAWALTWTNTIRWRAATVAPTISTSPNISDIITILRSNSSWFADISQNFGS